VAVQFPRYVCIHGHFYQPPRENPWLEAIEVQDSAAPYHDWNERITRECYGPNCRSRLVDGSGKIIGLLNNYAWMSFNFGPTLLDWMVEAAPDVVKGIMEGDRLSRERRGGHGNALAQVYNHVIMPLASVHDQRTQVLWGLVEFRRRYGHEPEGMWLPETAADGSSLEALAAAGVRFTILAPRQAKRWRRIGDPNWTEIPEGVDPSRAYQCRLPSGKSIVLFFYDGVISRQVAFERLLDSGEKFLGRLMQGFDDSRQHAQLMHIATDGESYGHHHPHGDMALAYVLDKLSKNPEIRLTNYGEFLDLHPPEWEVEIHENSSWSCVHGVERWRSDCGCKTRGDWHQRWRGPLRQAFDWLKSRLDNCFAERGAAIFTDPWAARDGYVEVILDRDDSSVQRFMERFAKKDSRQPFPDALWLLEMQRHGMLMYTSCGWFFDEISGLEATQCLRYAARAIQLARHFNLDLEGEFVHVLEQAPSNLPEYGNGRAVWEKLIHPTKVDLDRVLAHHAMSLIYRSPETESRVYCYDLKTLDREVRSRGESHVAIGRLHVHSRLTMNEAETNFVVIHYGALDFHNVLRASHSVEEYDAFKAKLFQTFDTGSLADVTELIVHDFQGETHRLDDLFSEERRRIIGIVLQERFEDYQRSFERLAEQDEGVLNILTRVHYPIPRQMRTAASAALDRRLRDAIASADLHGKLVTELKPLIERGKVWGYQVAELDVLCRLLEKELLAALGQIVGQSEFQQQADRVNEVLDTANLLNCKLDLWQAQNELLREYVLAGEAGTLVPATCKAFGQLSERLNISSSLLGWRP
jgi:alpha-amylase/alpha-mannosidase (GH57 family)